MISSPSKVESEADFDQSNISSSSSSSLSYHSRDIKNKGAAEQRNRVKKLRSIKLGRLPSLRVATRRGKIQSDISILASARVDFPDVSPNYMRNTTCSDAKKESLQKSARSSFKPGKSLTRLSSTKYRRSLMRKSSGGSDIKKKTKKLRSIRHRNHSSIVLPDDEDASSMSIDSFDVENTHFQASSHNSESGLSSNDENKSSLSTNLASGNKSTRAIKRTSSLRTPRILTKKASFRTKRPFVKKSSRILDSSIQKATCSSALKDSKMADNLEVQPSGSESEGISTMKVCPYSYCSLHGHTHSNVPPLKRFVSMRRRVLKKQKSIKLDSPSFRRAKRSNNTKRGIQRSEMASSRDAAETAQKNSAVTSIQKTDGPKAEFNSEGSKSRDDGVIIHSESVADSAYDSHEEISSSGRGGQPDNRGRITTSNLDMLMGDSEQDASDANSSPSLNDDSFNTSRNQILKTSVESKAIDRMGPASAGEILEEQVAATEEMEKDSYADSEFDGKTEADETGMKKQKNVGLWSLIFQHMATSPTAEGGETQPPLDKLKKEDQGDDENTLSGMQITDSSRVTQNDDLEDNGIGSPNIQLYQRNAIKLVQEAFDKILSEIPDHSSDDRSIIKDATSEKESGEANDSETRELKFSTSIDSGEYRTVQDQQEIDIAADERKEKEREKAESKMGSISDPQTPKNWSNLKKILILRRFVKALEKVKGMKLRKPQYLPVQPDPEVEKIRLRRQSLGERKNSEEWMLDYALQHVISTLAPAQKRKVSLLVQAFETIVPLPEIGTSPRSDIATSTHATPIHTSTASLFERGTEKGFQTFGVSLRKTSNPDMISKEDKYHVCDSSTEGKESIPESILDYKDPSSESRCIDAEIRDLASDTTASVFKQKFGAPNVNDADHSSIVSNDQPNSIRNPLLDLAENDLCDQPSSKSAEVARCSHYEVLVNQEVQEKELASNYEMNGSGEKSAELKFKTSTRLQGSIDISNVVPPVPVTEVVDESSKATEVKTMLQQKFLQTLALHEKSKSNSAGIAPEKMKNTKLWYMIYKHMVSGTETDFDEASEKTELSDDADALNQKNDGFSHQECPVKSQNIDMENHNTDNQTVEMQQIEAIRMVEEAIDEISLPDSQDDSPDSQSVTKHIIPDHRHFKRQPDEGRDFSISNFIGCTRRSNEEFDKKEVEQISQDTKEPCLNLDREETKPKLSSQKSWSNLKKVILLKRFVKAMEKVKKFNPREPRFLPLDPADEQEKVNLRHQEMRDRKNADEWMLDYALQQVVAKLTPARKRKVELLVEAFETVVPTIGT